MAVIRTGADALRIYLTGDPDGASWSHAASLGGSKIPVELSQGFLVQDPIPGILIEHIDCPAGVGYLDATAGSLTWKAPGDTAYGAAVALTIGQSTCLISADATLGYIRVTNAYMDAAQYGHSTITVIPEINNAFSMGNPVTTGGTTYRALMIENVGADNIDDLYPLLYSVLPETCQDTSGAQLPASGAGTIQGPASCFAGWRASGWAYISKADTSLREIVYYASRTASVLTIPAVGRALLGTSASAGAANDQVAGACPFRFGAEALDANGQIQTIANETTVPSGITWLNGVINTSDGLLLQSLGPILAGGRIGLWIKREILNGATVDPQYQSQVRFLWTENKNVFGAFRVLNSARSFQLYKGEDAVPDFTLPPASSGAALPLSVVVAPPGAGTKTVYLTTRETNTGAPQSLNQYGHPFVIDATGALVTETLHAPNNVTATVIENCSLRIAAQYQSGYDDDPATAFHVWITTDGSTPNPAGAPTYTQAMIPDGLSDTYDLLYLAGPYVHMQTIKLLVRSYRAGDAVSSSNTAITTVAITTSSLRNADQPRELDNNLLASVRSVIPIPSFTLVESATGNIHWQAVRGQIRFYFDTVCAFVLTDNAFRTTWTITTDSVSGAASKSGVEVVDANTVYFALNDVRVMKLDLSTTTITLISQTYSTPTNMSFESGPVYVTDARIYFQAWIAGIWRTIATLSAAGDFETETVTQCTTSDELLG